MAKQQQIHRLFLGALKNKLDFLGKYCTISICDHPKQGEKMIKKALIATILASLSVGVFASTATIVNDTQYVCHYDFDKNTCDNFTPGQGYNIAAVDQNNQDGPAISAGASGAAPINNGYINVTSLDPNHAGGYSYGANQGGTYYVYTNSVDGAISGIIISTQTH